MVNTLQPIKVTFINIIPGDILVSHDRLYPKYENGTLNPNEKPDTVWGFTMISLMFLPNFVFIAWFIQGYRRNLWSKEGIIKILAVSCVQIVTLVRLVNI